MVDDTELQTPLPIRGFNRPHKSKTKHGSGCKLCKPHKGGFGPSADIKTIADMQSQTTTDKRCKAAAKKPRDGAWRVHKFKCWRGENGEWAPYKKGATERQARQSYEVLAKKVQSGELGNYGVRLIAPDGKIVEEVFAARRPSKAGLRKNGFNI